MPLALMVLSACATPRYMDRTEWLSVTTREFQGKSKEEVISAAQKLLRLADGDDFHIAHTDNGFHASRRWTAYMVIAAEFGTDHWLFETTDIPGGVRARVQVSTQSQAATPVATTSGAWTATTGPLMGSPVDGNALYDVFWARMEYLLGYRNEWMTCEVADKRVRADIVWGRNAALCNSFNVADDRPVEAISSAPPESSPPAR